MDNREVPNWIRNMEMNERIRRFSHLYVQKTAKGAFCSAQEIDAVFRIELGSGTISPLELSRQMGVSKPIVSRLLESLTEKGLVEKLISDSDRRSYYIRLTQKGRDTLEQAYYYYIEPVKKLEEKLGSSQYRELLRLIALANDDDEM